MSERSPAKVPEADSISAADDAADHHAEPRSVNTDEQAVVGVASGKPEIGGPAGPEPTRFGDWERKGRCIDF